MIARKFLVGVGLVAAFALTACGGGGGGTEPEGDGGAASVSVAADEVALAYEQTELSGPADTPIAVNFNNPSQQQHNWVLVQPGQEQAVVDAALANGGNVPEGTPGVIVAGAVLEGGQQEVINVPATPAGTYPYICTVAGHYAAGMVGEMTIGE
jgi:uncharacterized cupredoxin-like copper-binding protein